MASRKVFSVFIGSSSESKSYAAAIADLIEENPLFDAVAWWQHDVAQPGDSFLEALFRLLRSTDFAIFVATPDDLLFKREKKSLAIRDNVLFEYGLFAGHLGRHSAVLIQVGDADLPSDLKGIELVPVLPSEVQGTEALKHQLRDTVGRCLNHLLQCRQEQFELALCELRDGANYLQPEKLRPLLAQAMSQRIITHVPPELTVTHLRALLQRYQVRGTREVGLPTHRARLDDFIDLSIIEPEDLKKLSATFARFAAKYLATPCEAELCATRVALHYKEDIKLLAAVIARMQVRPALVELEPSSARSRIKGRYLCGEHAILLHDFTLSGYTPLECISALRQKEVTVKRIVSFFVREENLEEVEQHCSQENVDFKVFCVRRISGELEIRRGAA